MAECSLPPPTDRDGPVLADWAETIMLVEGHQFLSRVEIRGRLLEDGPPDSASDILNPDVPQETLDEIDDPDLYQGDVERLFAEVRLRSDLAREIYPFEHRGDGVSRRPATDSFPYSFFLWLSLIEAPFRKESYSNPISRLFDHLCLAAFKTYLGTEHGLRFGWPPAGDGRPGALKPALVWLAKEISVEFNDKAPVKGAGRDGGVDIVAWKPFRDDRRGFVVGLGQCTIAHDWEKKAHDIVEKLWRAYLTLAWDPFTALFVPYCIEIDQEEAWGVASFSVTMLVDRMRLCQLLGATELSLVTELTAMIEWVEAKRTDLSA